MTRRYGRLLAATLAALLAVTAAGCSSDGDGDKASAGNDGKIEKVTYLTAFGAVGRDAFAWVAKEKGYFTEAGFDVDIQLGAGTDPNLTKLTGGQAQFGSLDMTGIMINAGNGKFKGVKAIATVHQQTLVSIMASEAGTVKAPKDLEGKKLGAAAGSVNQLLFPAYAKLAGFNDKAVTFQDLPATGLVQALASKSVDAVSTFLISRGAFETATKGKMVMLPYSDYLRDLYGNGIITTNEIAEKNPDMARRFRDAILKALRYSIEHPEEAADIMAKSQPAANKAAAVGEIKLMTPYVTAGGGVFGELNKDRASRAIAILQGAGLMPAGLTAEQIIDFDLTPKA